MKLQDIKKQNTLLAFCRKEKLALIRKSVCQKSVNTLYVKISTCSLNIRDVFFTFDLIVLFVILYRRIVLF